jgi:membrane fusion protein (multidrug efflux system)
MSRPFPSAPRAHYALSLALCLGALPMLAACGKQPAMAAGSSEPLLVETVAVGVAAGSSPVRATGTVRVRRETVLGFTTAGRVAAIDVDEGDVVRAGQPIARLAPDQVGAANAAAQAEADRAEADFRRQSTLFASGWTTRARLETAQAAARSARAQVSATGFDLKAAALVAASPGVVLRRHVERNQVVAAGAPIVTVADLSGGYVIRVPLSDRDLGRVAVGSTATVRLPALGGADLAGRIVEIGGRGDERTGTFEAEIALAAVPALRSGLIGDVEIAARPEDGGSAARLAVPPLALFAVRAGEGFVYVVEEGRARARLVQLAAVTDRDVQVAGGLRPGERVVTSGVQRLRNNMVVRQVRR